MNRLSFIFLILITGCVSSSTKRANHHVVARMDSLIEVKDYFKLKSLLEENTEILRPSQSLFYRSLINSAYNKHEQSNIEISELLSNYRELLSDTTFNRLTWIRRLNHIHLYEYKEASEASAELLNHYNAFNDDAQREKLMNENKLWQALSTVPQQEMIRPKECTIPTRQDSAGFLTIEVLFSDQSQNMVFDTGSGYSVLSRSVAGELNLKIQEVGLKVTAPDGKKVSCAVAVADSIIISTIKALNVVFLIIDDEDLTFHRPEYHINGIIGYPVIEAMKEIRIRKDRQIIVPELPAEYVYNNFVTDGFTPMVEVGYASDTLRFAFDTRASRSHLYPLFYSAYQDSLINTTLNGKTSPPYAYFHKGLTLQIAESETTIDTIPLQLNGIDPLKSQLHGVIGQDFIDRFDEMIISFEYASISFN